MAGTTNGGKQAAATNRKKHGANFYAVIGALGGKKGTTGGFYSKSDEARAAGKLGGHRSKRGYKLIEKEDSVYTYENRTDGSLLTINWGEKYDYGK